MEARKDYTKIVEVMTAKAEKLIEQYPHLRELQTEVDRLLSRAPDGKIRQEIMDIMFHACRDDFYAQLHHLNSLLESALSR